jgi:transcriptional regulator with XRE-family HTH domain
MTAPTTVRIHGDALRELRIRSGYGLDGFAHAAEISRPYLSLLETGRRERVSPEIFARMCLLLGVINPAALMKASDVELPSEASSPVTEPAA